jgi:hypothetical protein
LIIVGVILLYVWTHKIRHYRLTGVTP